MYAITELYYNLSRYLLMSIGIWPYQQSHFALIQKILALAGFLSFILVQHKPVFAPKYTLHYFLMPCIFRSDYMWMCAWVCILCNSQLLVFSTRQCSTTLLLEILAIVFPTFFVMIKYGIIIIEADRVRHLMRHMQADCCLLKDKQELAIVYRYARSLRFITLISIVLCYSFLIVSAIFQNLPCILDYVSPLNESRSRHLLVTAEFFVSQETYFYALTLYEALIVCLMTHTLLGVSAIVFGYKLHSCALFKIASYRIENAISKDALEVSCLDRKDFVYKRITNMIAIHQRAIQFTNLLQSLYGRPYALLIFVGVASTTINMVQLFELLMSNDLDKTIIIAMLTFICFSYMFAFNFYGQLITDHAADLFRASYNGMWYAAPLRTQKLLLFVMQKGILSVHLQAGILIPSLECFSTLASSTISYFTIIYSIRQ